MDIRSIKLRIKSVEETNQVTRAMKLISASKLRRARNQLNKTRPFFLKIEEILAEILPLADTSSHPFFALRSSEKRKRTAYLVLTGDKGMAGGYNNHVLNLAEEKLTESIGTRLFVAGQTGRNFLLRKGYNVVGEFDWPVQFPTPTRAKKVADTLIDCFLSNEVDEVCLIYTRMISMMRLEPVCVKLLPLDYQELFSSLEFKAKDERKTRFEYEPSPEALFDTLIPHFIRGIVYEAFVESFTSEQSARMTAMDSATQNAEKLLANLQLSYNRARQTAITQEISEIVGGATALHS
jgi:F-type H+-transporting ATPase subunit gamma